MQLCIFLCPLKLLWKWNNLLWAESRPFPNCLPGSFEVEEDPDPRTGRAERFSSEWGQLRTGHTSHLPPAPLCLPLWHQCRHRQVSGWNRQDPSAANQRKGISLAHRLFHLLLKFCWQPGEVWEPPLSSVMMASQCTSTQYYFQILYEGKKKKKDRLYIRKHFYNYLYACMCIHKYIHICMYAVINILHLCLNWR